MSDLTMAVAAVAILGGVALAGPLDGKKVSDDGKGGRTVVLQIDTSKLPPDLLKQLLAAAGDKKPEGAQKPAGDKKPGGEKKPEGDKKPGDKKPGEKKPEGDKKAGAKNQISRAEAIAAAEKLLSFLKSGGDDKAAAKKLGGDEKPGQKGKKGEDQKPGQKGQKKG
jgi:hypothetical protein